MAVLVALTLAALALIAIGVSNFVYDEIYGVAWFAVVGLMGLPGLMIISLGWSWPGDALAESIQPSLSRLDQFGIIFNGKDLRLGDVSLDGWGSGLITGAAVALLLAAAYFMLFLAGLLWITVAVFRSIRPIEDSSRGWFAESYRRLEELSYEYQAWASKTVLLRWWCYGTMLGRRRPPGWCPLPRSGTSFSNGQHTAATLSAWGTKHVWMHDALRAWFEKYQDERALAVLLGPVREPRSSRMLEF